MKEIESKTAAVNPASEALKLHLQFTFLVSKMNLQAQTLIRSQKQIDQIKKNALEDQAIIDANIQIYTPEDEDELINLELFKEDEISKLNDIMAKVKDFGFSNQKAKDSELEEQVIQKNEEILQLQDEVKSLNEQMLSGEKLKKPQHPKFKSFQGNDHDFNEYAY